jgi:formate dehydrogenase maturation protein FdhE
MSPAFGLEILHSNSKNEAREFDKFMDELFTDAGLPLVHIVSSEMYNLTDIVALFQLAMMKIDVTTSSRERRDSDSVPQCPVCGKMMVLRIKRTGMGSGKKYYGCMDSPRCAGIVAID